MKFINIRELSTGTSLLLYPGLYSTVRPMIVQTSITCCWAWSASTSTWRTLCPGSRSAPLFFYHSSLYEWWDQDSGSPCWGVESRSRRHSRLSGHPLKRGDLYRVPHPSARDPKRSREFVVVSRQVLIDSKFSTVICAPIYSAYHGLSTQV